MVGKTEIGIITRKGAVDQGDYALASAKRILAAYNDYFGTPYPLPKMDMIAAPGTQPVLWRDGELGRDLLFRTASAARSEIRRPRASSSRSSASSRTKWRTSGSATS